MPRGLYPGRSSDPPRSPKIARDRRLLESRVMKKQFWSDPYLWVHGAGLAVVPLALLLCLWGLGMGDPLLPSLLEVILVALAGILPIGWMQLQRPFCIYSLPFVVVDPSQLTEAQRRLLTLFRTQRNPWIVGLASGGLFLVLRQLYEVSGLFSSGDNRGLGLVLAALGFLAANLFLQVPLSVLRVMGVTDDQVAQTLPYPIAQIKSDFWGYGRSVPRLLPDLRPD
jgi:hypothetical protein